MEALADKVHRQGGHNPHHCYISQNHPYISSNASYLGIDGCVKCSNVVECALLVCVLCQPVSLSSHASLLI